MMTQDPYGYSAGDRLYPDSDYEIVEIKSRGGAGIVYRTKYKQMERAVKILAPRKLDARVHPDDLPPDEWRAFASTFQEEIQFLIGVSHPNIARILDYGICSGGPANGRPYYAMEFIHGEPFVEVVRQYQPSAPDLLRLIDEVLEAIVFLHGVAPRPIMHMDIKSENVLIRQIGTRLQAVLVDLGVAKPVPEANDSGVTTYRTTRDNTRPERQRFVHGVVPKSFIRDIYPDEDLFELGGLLDEVFSLESVKEKLLEELDEAGRSALYLFIARLRGQQDRQYGSAIEVRRYLRKLFPEYAAPMGVPELALAADTVKHIAIPNGRIRLTRRVGAIVNDPVFQRLQRLHQLNFVYLLFPGAHHTRFLHSLQSYSLCREFVWALLEDARFRLAVDQHDLEAVLLYALLHDVGHYPLSHMFEDFNATEGRRSTDPGVLTDDDVLRCLLYPDVSYGQLGRVASVLRDCLRQRGIDEPFAELRQFSEKTRERLRNLILGPGEGRPLDEVAKVLRGIVDGPVDVDKVAYLQLDSLMTGVEYGNGIDLEGLLGGLRYPEENDIASALSGVLGITDKGLAAAESVILARYWMIKRVYWHHTNRAIMAMVKFVVHSLREVRLLDFPSYLSNVFFSTDLDALNMLCRLWHENQDVINQYHGSITVNPVLGLVNGSRQLYKRLLVVSRQGAGQRDAYEKIAAREGHARHSLCKDLSIVLERHLGRAIAPGALLIDVPDKERERSSGRVLIYRQRSKRLPQDGNAPHGREDVGRNIFDRSAVVASLKDEFDLHAKKCRVFLAPQLHDELRQMGILDNAREDVRSALYDAVGAKDGE